MELAAMGPLLAVLATALLGAIVYSYQKQVDRRSALIELRRTLYQEFLDSIFDIPEGGPSARAKYNKLVARLVVVASDNVVEEVGKWRNYMATTGTTERDGRHAKHLMASFIAAMRKDCFEQTKLAQARIQAILPIED